jgi:hypothetical protein
MNRMSLHFGVMRKVLVEGLHEDMSRRDRLKYRALNMASKSKRLQLRLYEYDEKYGPDWVERYIAFKPLPEVKGRSVSAQLRRVMEALSIVRGGIVAIYAEGFIDPRSIMWTPDQLKKRAPAHSANQAMVMAGAS